jgi:hypothetical protein
LRVYMVGCPFEGAGSKSDETNAWSHAVSASVSLALSFQIGSDELPKLAPTERAGPLTFKQRFV